MSGGADDFRKLLQQPGLIALPGCYDVLTAMLAEQAGFPAVFVSGYGVAASLLGCPDIGLTSLTETISVARNVAARVCVPVVLDLDNGYGNEDNVVRSVREAEAAGVAAIQLEDQVLPKRCGHAANKQVCDIDTALRKLEHALNARRGNLCVIARTDALDLDDAIHRAQRFHAAGADVTIVDGLASEVAIRRVADEVPGPKQVNLIVGGKTPLLSNQELEALGYKIVLYSTPALYVSVKAVSEAFNTLRGQGSLAAIAASGVEFPAFQGMMESHHQRKRGERAPLEAKPIANGKGRSVIEA
jgi:2-methylisocitrate lyase-like PEP mutase family enzyme